MCAVALGNPILAFNRAEAFPEAGAQQALSMLARAGTDYLQASDVEASSRFDDAIASFVASGALQRLLQAEAECVRDDPDYCPQQVVPARLTLYEDPACRMDLIRVLPDGADAAAMHYSDAASAIHVPLDRRDDLHVHAYVARAAARNDVFDPKARLELIGAAGIGNSHRMLVTPDRVTVHELRAERPVVCLRIVLVHELPYVWGFDRADGTARMMYPTDVRASRVSLALDYLQATAHPGVAQACGALRDSAWYFLRWRATQLLAATESVPLRELLERAVKDDHPEIRAAAGRALAASG